jgi:hypothetical protein
MDVPFILGTDGYIELRKYLNVAVEPEGDHLFLVNHEGEFHIRCSGEVGYPFFGAPPPRLPSSYGARDDPGTCLSCGGALASSAGDGAAAGVVPNPNSRFFCATSSPLTALEECELPAGCGLLIREGSVLELAIKLICRDVSDEHRFDLFQRIALAAIACRSLGLRLCLYLGLSLSFAVGSESAFSQAFTFTEANTQYTENFDAMGNTLSLIPGWLSTDTGILVGDGASGSGSVYNVGSTGSSDAALACLASASTSTLTFETSLYNGTGTTISSLSLAGMVEQWRTGSSASTKEVSSFSYSLNATNLTDTAATWLSVPGFNLAEIQTTSATSTTVDGSSVSNRIAISSGATPLIISWTPNSRCGSGGRTHPSPGKAVTAFWRSTTSPWP